MQTLKQEYTQEKEVIVSQQQFIEQCTDTVETLKFYLRASINAQEAEKQGNLNEKLMLELEKKNRSCVTFHNLLVIMCKLKRNGGEQRALQLGALVFAEFKEEMQKLSDPIEQV